MESKLFQKYIEDYKRTLFVKSYKNTNNYIQPVIEWMEWLEQKGCYNLSQLNGKQWQEYWQYLEVRPNKRLSGTLSDSSLNGHSFALKLFQEYLLQVGVLKRTISLPRRKNQTQVNREPLSINEVKKLYKITETPLEKSILSLAYGCGLRRNEMELLNTMDINFHKGILTVKKGKFGKRRDIPMNDKVLIDLKNYLINYRPHKLKANNKSESAFLIGEKGNRLKGGHLNAILQDLVEKAQLEKEITLHHLRHSIGTHLTENGASFEFVRDFLGHVELDTVHIYARRRKFNQIFKI